MPWWIPLFNRQRSDWSEEEKSVVRRIGLTALVIFFALVIVGDVYQKTHGGLRAIGSTVAYAFMALVMLLSCYLARVIWACLAPTLVKKADANAALRLFK